MSVGTAGAQRALGQISLAQLLTVRESFVSAAIAAVAFFGLPALVVTAARGQSSDPFALAVCAVVYVGVLALWPVRRWLSVEVRAWLLLVAFGAMSVLSLARTGLNGLGVAYLIMTGTVAASAAVAAGAHAIHLWRERARQDSTGQSLASWNQRFELVGALAGQVVYDQNLADGSVLWSASIREVLGYDLDEMTGGITQRLSLIEPADRDRVQSRIEQARARAGEYDIEYGFRHRAGHLVRVCDRGRLSLDPVGGPGHLIGVMRDMTKELHLEERLRQAQKLEAVGILATGVAHDFNNLLTPIIGFTDLLTSDLRSDLNSLEALGEIRKAARRATTLTQTLLTFGRKAAVALTPIDLTYVVSGLEKTLRRTLRENVTLRVRTEVEHAIVLGDAAQLELVLMNLVVNAQTAMPEGGTLSIVTGEQDLSTEFCRSHEPLRRGRHICFSVADTGKGIPPEIMPRIFEPFFTTNSSGECAGLGLATVYGVVKKHRGAVVVDSTPNAGTLVSVFLPRF